MLNNKGAEDACLDKHATTAYVFYHTASILPTLVWALFLGGKRRREMRRALNIPREPCCALCNNDSEYLNDDCCLHYWCTACALAQETRTILHEEATGQLVPHLVTVYEPPLLNPVDRV
jgi:Cys-rich protein (TIGR01571 family)